MMRTLLTALTVLAISGIAQTQAPYDVVIRNGRVLDGTGTPWFRADIAIKGDTIVRIARAITEPATRVIDAGGAIVAPGFIDTHTHARRGLSQTPTAANYVRQGVTTVIEGPDGSSPVPLAPFFAELETLQKSGEHRRLHRTGLDPVRSHRLSQSHGDARRNRKDGGPGRSGHARWRARNEHRIVLCAGHVHADQRSHCAGQGRGEVRRHSHVTSARRCRQGARQRAETIAIGEQGGLPTQVTHHKIIGTANWGKSADTLRLIDEARARGVDVTSDQYPYTASSTSISSR
jgi:hypothetical protein